MDPQSPVDRLRLERRWIRIREVGWGFLATWQILALASEFWPIDLESRAMRITGKILGLAGVLLVAYGFERLMRIARSGTTGASSS